jgi:hypothetical protein
LGLARQASRRARDRERDIESCWLRIIGLVSRPKTEDPPDCEGTVDGKWSAVEVTELVHEPSLRRSIKAIKQRNQGREPEKPEAYFPWDRDSLLAAVQERIAAKDALTLKGGPLREIRSRYVHRRRYFTEGRRPTIPARCQIQNANNHRCILGPVI